MRPLAVCARYSKATGVDWMRNVACRAINSVVGGMTGWLPTTTPKRNGNGKVDSYSCWAWVTLISAR
jgi:hypothetical protein